MTQDAKLTLLENVDPVDLSLSDERRTKIIMPAMISAFAAVVLLTSIAESRLTVEQRLELLRSSSLYPWDWLDTVPRSLR
jgi:hypothetical protein